MDDISMSGINSNHSDYVILFKGRVAGANLIGMDLKKNWNNILIDAEANATERPPEDLDDLPVAGPPNQPPPPPPPPAGGSAAATHTSPPQYNKRPAYPNPEPYLPAATQTPPPPRVDLEGLMATMASKVNQMADAITVLQ